MTPWTCIGRCKQANVASRSEPPLLIISVRQRLHATADARAATAAHRPLTETCGDHNMISYVHYAYII